LPGEPNSLFTAKLVEQIAAGQTADIQSLFEATYNAVLDASDVAGIQQTPKISNGLSAPLALRSA